MTGTGSAGGVQLRWGGASDVGQIRQVNQDSMYLGSAVFVVADGMGGHAGGEVASRLAIETIEAELEAATDAGQPHRVLDMVTAVQAANDRVWARSADDPNLAGMGTTVVAIGLVEEGGETRLGIVNVGDSRAYRLSGGDFDQISDDHSLVGEMYREGRISAREARDHPQKNIVTRAVGIDRYVDVDEFQVLPRTGDRYLLCSDGLTDELEEAEIADILRAVDDPDEAAAELVRRANEEGGRDNITIVIVDVVDDGLDPARAEAARPAVPDADDFSEHPDQDTQSMQPVPTAAPPATEPTDGQAAPAGRGRRAKGEARRPRALTIRSAAFVLVVAAILGGGGYLGYRWAQDTYHVTIDDREVTIFKGRPGGTLWWDPELVERTGIDVDDVPASLTGNLEDGVSQPTLERARRYVRNLEDRIERTTRSTTTTTTTTTATTSTTTAVAPG